MQRSGRPDVQSLTLSTSDGLQLEAEVRIPETMPWAAVIAAHPHPLHGGNMRSLIPGLLFRDLPGAGICVLRFNFRGVGQSEGNYDEGRKERMDILAAIDALHDATAGVPLIVAGSSFGADTCLCVTDERLAAWCCIAPPLRKEKIRDMAAAQDKRPKLLIVPEHDEFLTVEAARSVTARWKNMQLIVVPGTSHYLVGRTKEVSKMCLDFASFVAQPETIN